MVADCLRLNRSPAIGRSTSLRRAGDGPCLALGVGARRKGRDIRYPVNKLALEHGAGVETETTDPKEAYARFAEGQTRRLAT
jgi:hypothetical protein